MTLDVTMVPPPSVRRAPISHTILFRTRTDWEESGLVPNGPAPTTLLLPLAYGMPRPMPK